MNTSPLQLVLAALLGGGFAGAAVLFSARAPSVVETASAPVIAAAPTTDAALLARVAALEERNLALQMQLSLLSTAEPQAVRQPSPSEELASVSRAEFEALKRRLDDLQSSGVADFAEPEVLEEKVAGALTEIRKKETTQKTRSYNESRRAGLDMAIQKISEPLELSRGQSNDLRAALLAQYDREDETLRMWENGEADQRIAERKTSDLQLFNSDLGRVLNAQQLEQFWAIARNARK